MIAEVVLSVVVSVGVVSTADGAFVVVAIVVGGAVFVDGFTTTGPLVTGLSFPLFPLVNLPVPLIRCTSSSLELEFSPACREIIHKFSLKLGKDYITVPRFLGL